MSEYEKTSQYLKYKFAEAELREISKEMAQNVGELNQMEDDKKAVTSDFKAKIDGIQATINNCANKITSGFEMRRQECEIRPDYEGKVWLTIRLDTLDIVGKRAK